MKIQGQLTEEFRERGDPVRIIKHFLAALTLVGVAATVVLAPGLAGSTHSLADTGVASVSVTPDSVVWDLAS
jgi:hypothetical protein